MESNGNVPVTRADLAERLDELKRDLIKQIGEFADTRFRQTEERFTGRLHDAETRLLEAFYQY